MTSGTIHEDPHEFDEAHVPPRTEQVRIVGAARAAGGVEQTSPEAGTEARTGTEADRSGEAGADERWGPEGDAVPTEPRLPHWTEAPTGEIPAVLSRGDEPEAVDPWSSLPEPTWREEQRDWEQEEPLAPTLLAGHGDESPLLSEADEEERQPWSFDLGTAEVGPSQEEHGVDELDDLASGQLFGTSARPRPGRGEWDEGDVTGEMEIEDLAAGEPTSLLHLPGPGGLGEYSLDVEEEVVVIDEREVESGVEGEGAAGGFDGVGDGRDLAAAGSREHGRVRAASTWLHVRSRRGEHADAAAVAADAAAAASAAVGRPAAGAPRGAAGVSRSSAHRPPPGHRASGVPRHGEDALSQRAGRDIPAAIVSGIVIGGLALIAFHFGSVPSMVVVTAVLTVAAVEAYAAFRHTYRPATLLGIVAVAGVIVGSYDEPLAALPVVAVLLFAATVLWHLVGVDRRAEPVRSTAATLLVFCWIGVFGSFAALLLAPSLFPHRTGIAYLLGALIAAVAYDVGALVVGAWVGRHPLSPVSPGKTWEGVLGGAVAAIVFSVAIVHLVHPWSLGEAAALGVVVAVVSPIGDLCESLVKRQLGLKDMGRILPGHGGLLDRVDGLLFVLPAAYYLVRAFGHG